jgi:hypothetical protein
MRARIFAQEADGFVSDSTTDREGWGPTDATPIAQQWVALHRGHVRPGARSAFSAFRDSLWGPWRVWCHCGASLEASRASCDLICLVARPSVVRMEIDKWKAKTGDQTAIVW